MSDHLKNNLNGQLSQSAEAAALDRVSNTSSSQPYATPTKSAKQSAFIVEFAQHGIITKACEAAGIDRTTLYRWKEKDTHFLIRYNHAFEMAKDRVRAEIIRRAVEGVEEPVYQLGKYCGEITKYSDMLLMFHSKAIMPEYRDKQQVEISGSLTIKTEWGAGALTEESEVQHDRIS